MNSSTGKFSFLLQYDKLHLYAMEVVPLQQNIMESVHAYCQEGTIGCDGTDLKPLLFFRQSRQTPLSFNQV